MVSDSIVDSFAISADLEHLWDNGSRRLCQAAPHLQGSGCHLASRELLAAHVIGAWKLNLTSTIQSEE